MNNINNITTHQDHGQEGSPSSSEKPMVIPVMEEHLIVDKKMIETGKLQIQKTIIEEDIEIDIPLLKETNEIKKIPKNIYVDSIPVVRQEGEVTIIPVVHEVLVVEKKLLLVEEIHVVKTVIETVEKNTVTIKKEHVVINNIIN